MARDVQVMEDWRRDPWRYLMWVAAGGLALAAALAIDAIRHGEYARVILAALFGIACAIVELNMRESVGWAYKAGLILAVLTGVGQAYMNVVAGLFGSLADNPINLMFFLIPALTLTGLIVVRGRASGMVWVMGAAALAQVAAGVVGGYMVPVRQGEPPPAGIMFLTVYFAGLWLNAAASFRVAARSD